MLDALVRVNLLLCTVSPAWPRSRNDTAHLLFTDVSATVSDSPDLNKRFEFLQLHQKLSTMGHTLALTNNDGLAQAMAGYQATQSAGTEACRCHRRLSGLESKTRPPDISIAFRDSSQGTYARFFADPDRFSGDRPFWQPLWQHHHVEGNEGATLQACEP